MRCNDDKRFQLTVRINREKLAVELEIRSTSAKRTISLESIFLEERGWKEREREERKRFESVRWRNLSQVCLRLRGKVGPAHRMGIDTSAGP